MNINQVAISGNLTRDAELRTASNGVNVLNFCVAVNDRRKNPQTGEWEDYPNFLDCVAFGTRTETLAKYLLKGTKVALDGKLRWRQWTKDDEKRSKVEIIAGNIEFLSRNDDDAANDVARKDVEEEDFADEDIPF